VSEALESVSARLRHEQQTTLALVVAMEADMQAVVESSADSNADDEHDPEGATIAFERSRLATLITASRKRLDEITAALERVETGEHGRCAVCGKQISAARLEARPFAQLCLDCAAAAS
jgi:DnaK suppressor protein